MAYIKGIIVDWGCALSHSRNGMLKKLARLMLFESLSVNKGDCNMQGDTYRYMEKVFSVGIVQDLFQTWNIRFQQEQFPPEALRMLLTLNILHSFSGCPD